MSSAGFSGTEEDHGSFHGREKGLFFLLGWWILGLMCRPGPSKERLGAYQLAEVGGCSGWWMPTSEEARTQGHLWRACA